MRIIRRILITSIHPYRNSHSIVICFHLGSKTLPEFWLGFMASWPFYRTSGLWILRNFPNSSDEMFKFHSNNIQYRNVCMQLWISKFSRVQFTQNFRDDFNVRIAILAGNSLSYSLKLYRALQPIQKCSWLFCFVVEGCVSESEWID